MAELRKTLLDPAKKLIERVEKELHEDDPKPDSESEDYFKMHKSKYTEDGSLI